LKEELSSESRLSYNHPQKVNMAVPLAGLFVTLLALSIFLLFRSRPRV